MIDLPLSPVYVNSPSSSPSELPFTICRRVSARTYQLGKLSKKVPFQKNRPEGTISQNRAKTNHLGKRGKKVRSRAIRYYLDSQLFLSKFKLAIVISISIIRINYSLFVISFEFVLK